MDSCANAVVRTPASCAVDIDAPVFKGPTDPDMARVLNFEDPKPKWYNCKRSG
jgi:hypothetical protein